MSSTNKLYLNYDYHCCASFIIKTNTISSCKKIDINNINNGNLDK